MTNKERAAAIKEAYLEGMRDGLDIDDTDSIMYLWEVSRTKKLYDSLMADA